VGDNDAAKRRFVGHDQQATDMAWRPAERVFAQLRRQADLRVEASVQLLERSERALDLAHGDGEHVRSVPEEVD
jgi:hypothetical protein